jgi:hypothetical protein
MIKTNKNSVTIPYFCVGSEKPDLAALLAALGVL